MKRCLQFLAGAAIVFAALGFSDFARGGEAANEVFSTASCTGTTAEALAANRGRISALFINDATSAIYLKVGEDAVANEGIRLNPNGGSYFISNAGSNLDREEVDCITGGTTNVLLIIEWSN